MAAPEMFLSPGWAEAVRQTLAAGPDAATREGKLEEYWAFCDRARAGFDGSWALGVLDLPPEFGAAASYLLIGWHDGQPGDVRLVDAETAAGATYVLAGDFADWKAMAEGYDALRTVMYRKVRLLSGDLLEFFTTIYFFVECLELIGRVPTRFPEPAVAAAG